MQEWKDKDLAHNITIGNFTGDKIVYSGITHLKYEDCPLEDITEIEGYKLHKKVAEAFKKMKEAAKLDGIEFFLVSAFRSIEYQKEIFPCKFINKEYPTEEEFLARLQFSAPPGFSEHHTGLAIDINSLEQDFAETIEYKWLLKNAASFGFEMSFPEDNWQKLGFEPWHWRYVGDDISKTIFNNARLQMSN